MCTCICIYIYIYMYRATLSALTIPGFSYVGRERSIASKVFETEASRTRPGPRPGGIFQHVMRSRGRMSKQRPYGQRYWGKGVLEPNQGS